MLADPEEQNESESDGKRRNSTASSNKLQRQNSETSMNSVESLVQDVPKQVQETQQIGAIGLGLYKRYFSAGGGWPIVTVTALFCLLAQVLASGGDYFVSYWVNSNEKVVESENQSFPDIIMNTVNATKDALIANDTVTPQGNAIGSLLNLFRDADDPNRNNIDIYIFTAITVLTVAVALSRSFMFFSVAMRASTNLHNSMFKGISHASMYFFNTNPSGRILNRFSKDMGQVDEILPGVMMDVVQIFLSLFGIVVVVAMVNPLFLIPTLVLAIIFYYLRVFYLKTSRDVKRIEGISKYISSF